MLPRTVKSLLHGVGPTMILGASLTFALLGCKSQEKTEGTPAEPVSKVVETVSKAEVKSGEATGGLEAALLKGEFASQELWHYIADEAMPGGETKDPTPAPQRFCGEDASVKAAEIIKEIRTNFESANEQAKFKDSLKCSGSTCELVFDAEAMYRFVAGADGNFWVLAELHPFLAEEAKPAQEGKLKAFLDHAKKSGCGTK